jgi:hypothetical protein
MAPPKVPLADKETRVCAPCAMRRAPGLPAAAGHAPVSARDGPIAIGPVGSALIMRELCVVTDVAVRIRPWTL